MKPGEVVLTVILALALFAAPVPSLGQQPGKVYRIGYLVVGPAPAERTPQNCPIKGSPNWQAWLEGLQEHGYIWGRNLVIECRYTEGREERAPAFAAELVSVKPDLIFAYGSAQVRAAKQATSTIPIVMGGVIDPVEQGLVASLAQPGGNVTGLTFSAGREIVGKHLQLLKEAVPKVSSVAVLGYSGTPAFYRAETQAAAQALDLTLQFYEVGGPEAFEGAFTAMATARVEALLVLPHVLISAHRKRIGELAAQSRLPAVYPYREAAEAGGLMGYGTNVPAMWRRFGLYIDRIFKGAKPGDLPVEQPTKFELIINLKTAKTLGLTIPQSLVMRADEVIE
jgi:putative ABC transport system substrate-binding protein